MVRNKGNAAAILARFLDRFGRPPSNRMESDLERVWKRLRIENADLTESLNQTPSATQTGARSHLRILGVAAAILLVVTTALILRNRRDAAYTVIDTGGASLMRVADGKTLQAGDRLENGDIIQNAGSGAVLGLADGSRIEMRAQSNLSLALASDGVRILLNHGSVIVTAAKQRDGHLYVKTRDVTVSVVGTVFLVKAEETGSRVAVIQGEVHVQQGPELRTLLPGDQIATAKSMSLLPVADEISWSSNLVAHVALLQQSVEQTTAGTRKVADVSGRVTNALDGEALREVTVTLRNSEAASLYTRISSEDGSFLFQELRPGTYEIDLKRPGFTSEDNLPKLVVREGQDVNNVHLKATPLSVASGRVVNEAGAPLKGVAVQSLRYVYRQRQLRLTAVARATTDETGEFRVVNLPPGQYYFQAAAPETTTSPEEALAPTFYPSSHDVGHAVASDVRPGVDLSGIEIRLRKAPTYHVRGKVVYATSGMPAARASLRLQPSANGHQLKNQSVEVHEDGTFDAAGILGGTFGIFADHRENNRVVFGLEIVDVLDRDINDVLVQLAPPMEISGTLTIEGARSNSVPQPLSVSLQASDWVKKDPGAPVDQRGQFVIRNLQPNLYRVQVIGALPGLYVRSISSSGIVAGDGRIDLTKYQAGATLSIDLGSDGGQVRGIVHGPDGQPLQGAAVTVFPGEAKSDGRLDLFRRVTTDAMGTFDVRDLAPGNYLIFAWSNSSPKELMSREFRTTFEAKAVSLRIAPKATATINLKAITAAEIAERGH